MVNAESHRNEFVKQAILESGNKYPELTIEVGKAIKPMNYNNYSQ